MNLLFNTRTVFILLALTLVSCKKPLTLTDAVALDEGMTKAEVTQVLGEPKKAHQMDPFETLVYDMEVGSKIEGVALQATSKDNQVFQRQLSHRNHPKKLAVIQRYLIIFQEEKLVYWGLHQDLLRSSDEVLRQIGEDLN